MIIVYFNKHVIKIHVQFNDYTLTYNHWGHLEILKLICIHQRLYSAASIDNPIQIKERERERGRGRERERERERENSINIITIHIRLIEYTNQNPTYTHTHTTTPETRQYQ